MTLALSTAVKPIIMKWGNVIAVLARLTPSGSYPTGGDPIDLKPLNRYGGSNLLLHAFAFGKSGYQYEYDKTNAKLLVRVATTTGANIGLAEHSAAVYAAGVTGDEIWVLALFGVTQG